MRHRHARRRRELARRGARGGVGAADDAHVRLARASDRAAHLHPVRRLLRRVMLLWLWLWLWLRRHARRMLRRGGLSGQHGGRCSHHGAAATATVGCQWVRGGRGGGSGGGGGDRGGGGGTAAVGEDLYAVVAVLGHEDVRAVDRQPDGHVQLARSRAEPAERAPPRARLRVEDEDLVGDAPGWPDAAKTASWARPGSRDTASRWDRRCWVAPHGCGGRPRAFSCSPRSVWWPDTTPARRPP